MSEIVETKQQITYSKERDERAMLRAFEYKATR